MHKGQLGLSLEYFVSHFNNVGDIFMIVKFFIVSQRGTKSHWVNPLPIFKQNYVNAFEKSYMCKNSCCDNLQIKQQ